MKQEIVHRLAATDQAFLYQVYLPIGIWLIILLGFFILLLKKYTFGNWSKDKPSPFEGETFDMPRGTFRGILTLTLLYVTVILELVTVHTPGYEEEIREFIVAFQMMIAFYFGAKVMHHVTSADRQKAEIKANTGTTTQQSQTTDNTGGGTTTNDSFTAEGSMG